MPSIRVIALAVIRHPDTGALFVDETVDPLTGLLFHRPAGGGVEFGERAADALVRELDEEYGLAVVVGQRLGVLENHFTFAGRAGHEIALVFEVTLADAADDAPDRRPCRDQPHVTGVWRSSSEDAVPLYPEGLSRLVDGLGTH
ncbi:NUDIX domain-containing protein [Cellulomonas dongxiuzhuiae]|uniref:NUDIX domain-containing protein n=1 Tax=Cellulomonas dongxiuzhuiae TaxID=2819979 RepID=A0ABX8GIW6_9CELL|nr:NUDIX domain-containing protein [Cellulomonas dongxiuzhuiae]QWC15812.1 NUDIX domain-containing protein [Cellulomonas dongxiuzhuiae]